MYKMTDVRAARRRRHRRIRRRLSGSPARPRLCVFRSLQHIYAQIVDDAVGQTLASSSTVDAGIRATGKSKSDLARAVGTSIAERAREAGITQVVFDRAGYLYHGRVKALADAAREAGLEF